MKPHQPAGARDEAHAGGEASEAGATPESAPPSRARRPRARDQNEAIRSAEAVTFMRALLAREPDERVRNPDHMAVHFLGLKWRLIFRPHWLFTRLIDWYAPGCFAYHVARTKHFDSVVLEGVRDGAKQLVILGAGNDSRAYRLRRELSGVRIFELDFPGTQARKRRQLIRHFGALPDHVTYAPIDFTSESIEDVLMSVGYDPDLLTCFLWEGVCYYLPDGDVDRVLRFFSRRSPAGSPIAFDYMLRSFVEGDTSTHGAARLLPWYEKVGEPVVTGFNEGEIAPYLAARGIELLSDLGPEELERRYLTRADGSLLARPYGMFRLAHARVAA